MRVSERQRFEVAGSRVDKSRTENADLMEKLATQKKVNRISDDPVGIAEMYKLRGRISGVDQQRKNIEFANGFISRTETAVQSIHESLIRAKELSIGVSSSTYGAESREATSREIKELMNNIKSMANAQYNGRYVFSGFRTQTPALNADGQYLGDDGEIFLPVTDKGFQKINVTARQLFEPSADERADGHFGLLGALDLLYSGLVSDDQQQIRKSMSELDFQMTKTSSYQSTLGSLTNSLEKASEQIDVDDGLMRERLSSIEDADIFEASSDFKKSEAVLQSTLMASNRMLQPSLLNFMQ